MIGSLSILAFSVLADHLQFINIHGGFESIDAGKIHDRAIALGRDPNNTALYLSIAIPFTLYYIIIYKDVFKRTFLTGCLIILTYGIIITHSIGGVIGLISIMLFFVLFHKNVGVEKKAMLFISLLPILFAIYFLSPTTLKTRIQEKFSIIQNEDFSKWGTGRGAIWLAALKIIEDNPFLGVGVGNSGCEIAWHAYHARKEYKVAHNTFLPIATETGLIGLFIFIMLIGSILKNLYTKLKISPPTLDRNFSYLGSAIYLSLASFFVQAMFLNMERDKYLWLLLGLAATFATILNQGHGRTNEK